MGKENVLQLLLLYPFPINGIGFPVADDVEMLALKYLPRMNVCGHVRVS